MTKHNDAKEEALGTNICLILDSPSIHTEPITVAQPKYSISKFL